MKEKILDFTINVGKDKLVITVYKDEAGNYSSDVEKSNG